MDGELEQVGERWRLRLTRRLAHPPETVWRAITETDHLEAWFPDRVTGEWVVGAPLRFEPRVEGVPGFGGEVLAVDPPVLLEFRWGTDVVRFEIEAADGGCLLTLLDTIDELGKAALNGAGWHVCLDRLEHDLAGTTPMWTDGDRWREVHPDYVEAFGPAGATVGPPTDASG